MPNATHDRILEVIASHLPGRELVEIVKVEVRSDQNSAIVVVKREDEYYEHVHPEEPGDKEPCACWQCDGL